MSECKFNCDACGQCCMHLDRMHHIELFREMDRGDGRCIHLMDDMSCDIYETRPDLCSVEKAYELVKEKMTREQFYQINYKMCEELKALRDKK